MTEKINADINILGCGYIGKKVAGLLMQQGKTVNCFVKSKTSKSICASEGLSAVQFDLDKVSLALSENEISKFENSIVAYFAPPQPVGETDQRVQYFIALLKTLAVAPKKILLISTTGVYGNCKGEWIDEQRKVLPQADRAHRRLSAETLLKRYCENSQTQFIIFRVPGIYAADKLPVKRIRSGEPVVNALDSGFTNRVHADDLSAFCAEALTENVSAGIYNCCDGKPSTMNDYFMQVADVLNLPRPPEISLQQAQQTLSAGMLSYLSESKRISNKKLLSQFKTRLSYPDLTAGLYSLKK